MLLEAFGKHIYPKYSRDLLPFNYIKMVGWLTSKKIKLEHYA